MFGFFFSFCIPMATSFDWSKLSRLLTQNISATNNRTTTHSTVLFTGCGYEGVNLLSLALNYRNTQHSTPAHCINTTERQTGVTITSCGQLSGCRVGRLPTCFKHDLLYLYLYSHLKVYIIIKNVGEYDTLQSALWSFVPHTQRQTGISGISR